MASGFELNLLKCAIERKDKDLDRLSTVTIRGDYPRPMRPNREIFSAFSTFFIRESTIITVFRFQEKSGVLEC